MRVEERKLRSTNNIERPAPKSFGKLLGGMMSQMGILQQLRLLRDTLGLK